MVKKKQPCTHFYCFIVSIIAALFKFYTKSVKIIYKIFFRIILAALLEDFRKILAPVLHIRIVAAAVKVALMTPLSSSIYAFSSLPFLVVTSTLFLCSVLSLFSTLSCAYSFFQIMGRVHLSFSLAPTLFYGICGVTENNFFRWLIATNAAICHNSLSSIRERSITGVDAAAG